MPWNLVFEGALNTPFVARYQGMVATRQKFCQCWTLLLMTGHNTRERRNRDELKGYEVRCESTSRLL